MRMVRDEISGAAFESRCVVYVKHGTLPRTTWHGPSAMLHAVATARALGNEGDAWAESRLGGSEPRWMPVGVLAPRGGEA